MAGTIVKLLDCKGSTTGANAIQEQFVLLYTFMEAMVTAGHCTRIALQWGSGGTGTQFWDEATPFGENAFAVYTWGAGAGTARDVLIQWAASSDFGIAPGNPGTLNGVAAADGVGIAMATREDGTSPWGGTTNNDGTDTKGTPVWTPGGSAVHAIEQTNSAGSHSTNKENCYRTALDSPNAMRMHIVGDADNIAILSSETDDGGYRCFTLGRYVPRVGFSGPNPLYAISEMGFPMWAVATYGTSTGIGTRQSGILGRLGADGIAFVRIGEILFSGFLTTTYQPNQQVVPQQLDGVTPLLVYGSPARYGLCGSPDGEVIAVFFTDNNEALDPTGSRAYMGDTGGSDHRWGIPWDGGPAPGVGVARAGRLS